MATVLLLQRAPERPRVLRRPEDRPGLGGDAGRVLVCSACLHAITRTGARIEMSGGHAHTFSNPHGFVFHIGCFAVAPGCEAATEASHDFSWFPGFAWQVAVCGGCGEHLGWLFVARERRFHGLIVDRLTEAEEPGSSN